MSDDIDPLVNDRLEHIVTTSAVLWRGELICADGYELHIRRLQVTDDRGGALWVKTATYSYHALHRRREATRQLFRYDNIHVHPHHDDPHHRHGFDRNGLEMKPVEHIGVVQWPNLGQVLDELFEYWKQRL